MDWALIQYPFVVGVMTFFNPCGFALLPAYVSRFLSDYESPAAHWADRGMRGLTLGLTVSAGFLTIFALLGAAAAALGNLLVRHMMPFAPWVGAAVGLLLIVVGAAQIAGRPIPILLQLQAWTTSQASPRTGNAPPAALRSYYAYGLSYAVCSVGCTLPLFLSVLLTAFTYNWAMGFLNFLAYAWGMTLMMLIVSLVTAYSKGFLQRYFLPLMRWVPTLAAAVLIAVGFYLIYYQLIYSGIVGF